MAAEVLAADGAPSVIVISGAATSIDRLQFEALGISAYLPKPFAVEDLAPVVDAIEPRNQAGRRARSQEAVARTCSSKGVG